MSGRRIAVDFYLTAFGKLARSQTFNEHATYGAASLFRIDNEADAVTAFASMPESPDSGEREAAAKRQKR